MAISGSACPAMHVRIRDGNCLVTHTENRPADILAASDVAATRLLSGLPVWIRSDSRAELERLMGRPIRALSQEYRDT